MKFRFCGDGDCPDWVLAEIISTLSTLSAITLEQIAKLVAKSLTGASFDETAMKALTTDLLQDGKSAIACIHYLLMNAARNNVTENIFGEEIQQLGLPNDHADALCRVLSADKAAIRQRLIEKSLKINELKSVKHIPSLDDNICAKFEFKIGQELVNGLPQDTTHVINIERTQLKVLLAELKQARSLLDKYDEDSDKEDDDIAKQSDGISDQYFGYEGTDVSESKNVQSAD